MAVIQVFADAIPLTTLSAECATAGAELDEKLAAKLLFAHHPRRCLPYA